MGALRTVKVRCPGCDRQLEVTPRVTAVRIDARGLVVTFDDAHAPHDCAPPHSIGFQPNPKARGGAVDPSTH